MKKNMLTKGLIFAMTMALTIAPMSVSATVRDNAGGGTLEGKTDVGSLTEKEKKNAEKVDWILPSQNPDQNHWVFQNGKLLKGTMANNSNKTIDVENVSESDDQQTALISIPTAGYYDTSSKIAVPIDTLKNKVPSLNSSFLIKADCKNHVIIDISYIENYQDLTAENFHMIIKSASSLSGNAFTLTPRFTYDAQTGILKANGYGHHESEPGRADAGIGLTYDIYLW